MSKIIANIILIGALLSNTNYDTYSVIINSSKDLDNISKIGAIIDHYHNGNEVHILATKSQYKTILNSN